MQDAIVIDKNGNYAEFVQADMDENGQLTPYIYQLKEGESLVTANVDTAMRMIAPRWDGKKWVETGSKTPEEIARQLADDRQAKTDEVNAACQATIAAGVDVDGKHYSLTAQDQTNLMALQAAIIAAGAETVLYHADGELCGPYTADEIGALATTANRFITYNISYCNHLHVWIDRTDGEELAGVSYQPEQQGADLPEDLRAHLAAIFAEAGA